MKKYEVTYKVADEKYSDTEVWGKAWALAKAKAEETKAPIYRTVTIIEVREEVYSNGIFVINRADV